MSTFGDSMGLRPSRIPYQVRARPTRTSSTPTSRVEKYPGWNGTNLPPRDDAVPEEEELPGVGPNATRGQIEDYVRENYGYFAAFMNTPEVGTVLYNAAKEGWSPGKLQGALYNTSWWKSTDAANRTWMQLASEDPAEAQRQVNQRAASIQNRASTLGLKLSAGQIADIAMRTTQNEWSDEQVIDNILAGVNWQTLQAGDLTATRDNVKAIGADYLVNVSDSTAQDWAKKLASGEQSMDGIRSLMLKQAKTRFGWMADELDQGMTVKDYFAPTRDMIAQELEMPPESINMMDSKWLSMMERRGEDGKLGPASLHEAQLAARKDPLYAKTNGAQQTTTNLMGMISDVFGRRAV